MYTHRSLNLGVWDLGALGCVRVVLSSSWYTPITWLLSVTSTARSGSHDIFFHGSLFLRCILALFWKPRQRESGLVFAQELLHCCGIWLTCSFLLCLVQRVSGYCREYLPRCSCGVVSLPPSFLNPFGVRTTELLHWNNYGIWLTCSFVWVLVDSIILLRALLFFKHHLLSCILLTCCFDRFLTLCFNLLFCYVCPGNLRVCCAPFLGMMIMKLDSMMMIDLTVFLELAYSVVFFSFPTTFSRLPFFSFVLSFMIPLCAH